MTAKRKAAVVAGLACVCLVMPDAQLYSVLNKVAQLLLFRIVSRKLRRDRRACEPSQELPVA